MARDTKSCYNVVNIFAYFNSLIESVKDDLKPRTNFAWAKTADCLKKEKQINLKMLLENLQGVDTKNINPSLDFYKLTSQSIHGSALGINMSFNDYMSDEINDLQTKHDNIYRGYHVNKLGVAYVPVAYQVKFGNKSFVVDFASNGDN